MFACPVHSYMNDLPLPIESMNRKIKRVHSMSFHITISVIICSIEPGVSFCLNIYVLLVTRLKSDNVWVFKCTISPIMTSLHFSFSYGSPLCMV